MVGGEGKCAIYIYIWRKRVVPAMLTVDKIKGVVRWKDGRKKRERERELERWVHVEVRGDDGERRVG